MAKLPHQSTVPPTEAQDAATKKYTDETGGGGAAAGTNIESAEFELADASRLSIADASQVGLGITGDITLECWVNFESLPTFVTFISKLDNGAANDSFRFRKNGATLEFLISPDGTAASSNAVAFTGVIGEWQHLAMSREQVSGDTKFYLNGVQTGGTVPISAGVAIFDSTADFTVGGNWATNNQNMDGPMSEVRAWSVVRSDADILANYRRTLVGTDVGLQGYWRLDGNLLDSSLNDNDLSDTSDSPPIVFVRNVPFGAAAELLITKNGAVDLSNSLGPSAGQILTAGGPNVASWQTPSTGGGTDSLFAANFVRANDHRFEILDGSQLALDGMLDLTVEAWIRPSTLGIVQSVAGKYDTAGSQSSFRLSLTAANAIQAFVDNGAGTTALDRAPTTVLVTGAWRHIGFTRDGTTGDIQIYMDGIALGAPFTGVTGVLRDGTANFQISGDDQATTNSFDGDIGEVRVFESVRASGDIANGFRRRLDPATFGFVGYWPLDNNSADLTPKGNDLTPAGTGFPSFIEEVPFGTPAHALVSGGSTVQITGGAPVAGQAVVASSATEASWGDAGGIVRVSPNDSTPAELDTKLVEGVGITLTEQNDGGNETLLVSATQNLAGTGDYISARLSADQLNVVTADPIEFDVTAQQRGGLSLVANQIVGLKAGRTYYLHGTSRIHSSSPTGQINISWWNVTEAGYIGTIAPMLSNDFALSPSSGNVVTHIFTPTQDVTLELRVQFASVANMDLQGLTLTEATVIEIGATQVSAIGGLEYMDTIAVTGDVQTVTFGAGGDGLLQRALDGDVDEHYVLISNWKNADTPTTRGLNIRPNGISTDQKSRKTSNGTPTDEGAIMRIAETAWDVAHGVSEIVAKTGKIRTISTQIISVQDSALDVAVQAMSGAWNEEVTNITSLDIITPAGVFIEAGSDFTLYRRTRLNIRADSASTYERNVEATVAQGTNAEVEYTTGPTSFQGSAIGLAVGLNGDDVTGGSIDVDLKVAGATVLTTSLNTTDTIFSRALATPGAHALGSGDEITVGITTTSLTTTGGGTPPLSVNVMLTNSGLMQPPLDTGIEGQLWYPPAAPNIRDVEFNSGTLPSGWLEDFTPNVSSIDVYGDVATTGDPRRSINSYRRGWYMIQPPSDDTLYHIHRGETLPTNFFIWMRASFQFRLIGSPANNDGSMGLGFSMTDTGVPDINNRYVVALNDSDAGTIEASFYKYQGGAFTDIGTLTNAANRAQPIEYIGLQKLGNVYHGWNATANGTWMHMGSNTWGGGTIDRINAQFSNNDNSNPANKVMGVSFIRILETGDRLP
jgi:hypothetical protein